MATTTPMTVDDLLAVPDDGYRYDLVTGELRRVSPVGGEASALAAGVLARLWMHVTERGLGKVFGADGTFVLFNDPRTALVPDVAFVRADRLPSEEEQRRPLHLAPDLAVEVVSSGDSMSDVMAKVCLYLEAGTPLVWVVLPRRKQVIVHQADGTMRALGLDATLDAGDIVPGFRLRVADIFA